MISSAPLARWIVPLLAAACSDYQITGNDGGKAGGAPSSSTEAAPSPPAVSTTTIPAIPTACGQGAAVVPPPLAGQLAIEDVASVTVQGDREDLGNSVAIDDLDADGVPEVLVAGAG